MSMNLIIQIKVTFPEKKLQKYEMENLNKHILNRNMYRKLDLETVP